MGAMTIRGVDNELAKVLKEKAKKEGLSVNNVLLKALKEALGISKKKTTVYDDLDALAGTWSENDLREFKKKTADFEKVDKDMWK